MERKFKREHGFLVFAQNGETDYLRLAYGLALSLRATQKHVPYLSVAITPGMEVPDHYREVFDEVIDIPWIDAAANSEWKLENEWKAYHLTPYRHTIKLDADMLFTSDVSHWWETLARQEFFACTTVEDYRGQVAMSDFYRKTFTSNDLPNIYTAFMYFEYCDLSQRVFEMAEIIFQNWEKFSYEFLDDTRPSYVSTDVVFAMAIKLLDVGDLCTAPKLSVPRFVHMKSRLQDWPQDVGENWLPNLSMTLSPDLMVKVGRHQQRLPVHYHLKDALTDDMIRTYEEVLRVR